MTSEIGYTYPAYINSLVCGLFVDDDKEHLHDPNVWTGTNARLKLKFFTQSKTVELVGTLDVSCLKTNEYLTNVIDVRIILYPTKPEFQMILANPKADYIMEIVDISMIVEHVTVSPEVILAH